MRIDDCKRVLKLPRVVHMSFTQDTEESEVTSYLRVPGTGGGQPRLEPSHMLMSSGRRLASAPTPAAATSYCCFSKHITTISHTINNSAISTLAVHLQDIDTEAQ